MPPRRRSTSSMKKVAPPPAPPAPGAEVTESVCPVCGGRVVDGVEYTETATAHKMKKTGIYCTRCGVKFEFMPPRKV